MARKNAISNSAIEKSFLYSFTSCINSLTDKIKNQHFQPVSFKILKLPPILFKNLKYFNLEYTFEITYNTTSEN